VSNAGTSTLNLKRKRTLLLGGLTLIGALGAAGVLAVHHVPQAGPLVANSLRSVIGIRAVARLEEIAASAEDSVMRWQNERPRSLSDMSPTIVGADVARQSPAALPVAPLATITTAGVTSVTEPLSSAPDMSSVSAPVVAPLVAAAVPASIAPPYPEVAAPGDGVWIPVPDPERPAEPAVMYKTLLHPDPERPYTELFIVSMPSAQVKLTSVPGTEEPASENPAAAALPGRGLIPADQRNELLAAFNGGFRAEHGHHGMMVNGVTLLEPRSDMCTTAGYEDGSLQIGTFSRLAALPQKPLWYRQSPRCMVEQGALHPGLRDPNARGWGATLEGETVIRRSAIALSQDGERLFVAVTNFTTARALAMGMRAAGGWNVAQLDVNRSFPKFLLFPRDEAGKRHAVSLFQGFLYEAEEMIEEPNPRDFFYLVRRRLDERTMVAPAVALGNQAG
jgi:hypothetical protein